MRLKLQKVYWEKSKVEKGEIKRFAIKDWLSLSQIEMNKECVSEI